MDAIAVCSSESKESKATENGFGEPTSSTVFPFPRRIQFQAAKQPFLGFNDRSDDFHLETLNPSPQIRQPARVQNVKKFDATEVFETGLSPELSFSITFRKIGAGLENLGNTCFLNSVLQCLTYTEPLAAYLQSGKHQSSCRVVGFCALCAIQRHVNRALQSTGRILAPKDLVSNLRCISRNFRIARQEDAHEYMVNLLESMHKCCLPLGIPSESPGAYEKSLVHKIFGGRLRSQVKCMQCFYSSNKFDPFLDLSLEIHKADTLHKALSHFTSPEELDGGERQYQCQHCKQKVSALKQLTVHKAPYVLTIHLKRFASHNPGHKIDKKIQFGATLDLNPFVSGSYQDEDLNYTLYGVLVHAGWSTHSGHYYCFIRTSSAIWYSLDDNRVFQVSEKTVMEQKAYMLFYVRDTKSVPSKKPSEITKLNPRSLGSRVDIVSSVSHELASKRCFMNGSFIRDASSDGPIKVDVDENSIKRSLTEEQKFDQTPLTSPANGLVPEDIPKKVELDDAEKAATNLTKNENNEKAAIQSVVEPQQPSTSSTLVHGQQPGSFNCKNKPKKNSVFQFPNMRFAARMLLLQSRKNEIRKRRIRRKFADFVNSIDRSLSDEPSTSERSKEDCNIRDGSRSDFAVPRPLNAGQPVSAEENPRVPVQDGFVRLLTRGLEDTIVGRWDDDVDNPRPTVECDGGVKHIGYVLDEWDEEYDKGKRKKVRKSLECFGGPNLFQKIATQKLMMKKMRINWTGFEN